MSEAARSRDRAGKRWFPPTRAVEPTSYDRKLYGPLLLTAFLLILLVLGFTVYTTSFKKERVEGGNGTFDFSSLDAAKAGEPVDRENPCMVIQRHLDMMRKERYEKAYEYLCAGLKAEVTFDAFEKNARGGSLLFRDVARYEFDRFDSQGSSAGVTGYIHYRTGDTCRVEAAFAREGEEWRIARLEIVFQ